MRNSKNNNLIMFGIVAVVIIFIVLLSTGVINFKGKNSNANPQIDSNIEKKEEVLKIIGLTENGYKRMTEEDKVKYELKGDNYIDYNFYDIAKVFMDLNAGEYKVMNLDKEALNKLIFNYALIDSIELENLEANGDPNHPCYEGVGSCFGITEENYKKIATVYELSEKASDVLQKYGELYIIKTFPTVDNPHEITDNLSMKKVNGDVEAKYDLSLKPTQDYNQSGSTFNKTITYTLKMNSNNEYYLTNIKVEEK